MARGENAERRPPVAEIASDIADYAVGERNNAGMYLLVSEFATDLITRKLFCPPVAEPTQGEIEAAAQAIAYEDHIASLCAVPQWETLSDGRKDMLRRHAKAALTSRPAPSAEDWLRPLAKKLSGALLTLRPLGGSEMFVTVGDDYFADADLCTKMIQELRDEVHGFRLQQVRDSKSAPAAEVGERTDNAQMAKTMGSLLALTESLLDGEKYEAEDGARARSLVQRIRGILDRSNKLVTPSPAAARPSGKESEWQEAMQAIQETASAMINRFRSSRIEAMPSPRECQNAIKEINDFANEALAAAAPQPDEVENV